MGRGKNSTVVYGGPNRKEQDGRAGREASRFDYQRLVGRAAEPGARARERRALAHRQPAHPAPQRSGDLRRVARGDRGAERWIHLELFQFEGDRTGRRFAEAITQKAREGVRVRVLYDWLGSLMVPRYFWRELRRAGVDVRVVNPRR